MMARIFAAAVFAPCVVLFVGGARLVVYRFRSVVVWKILFFNAGSRWRGNAHCVWGGCKGKPFFSVADGKEAVIEGTEGLYYEDQYCYGLEKDYRRCPRTVLCLTSIMA